MIRPLNLDDHTVSLPDGIQQEGSWIEPFNKDFKKRILTLLGFNFRHMNASLAYQFLGNPSKEGDKEAK